MRTSTIALIGITAWAQAVRPGDPRPPRVDPRARWRVLPTLGGSRRRSAGRRWALLVPVVSLLVVAGTAAGPAFSAEPATPDASGSPLGSIAETDASGASGSLGGGFVHEGIEILLEFDPLDPARRSAGRLLEGDDVTVRFKITDTTSGTPMTGLYPAAWMDLLPPDHSPDPDECRVKVETFLGGSLLSLPQLDLNVYYVLSLNGDASISVVDPLFGFGGSKLLAMIFLKEPAEDWAMSPDQERIFVSLPESGEVGVVETANWQLVTYLDAGTNPRCAAIQPDGRYLWIGNDGQGEESGVTIIDTRALHVVRHIPTGAGHHEIAFGSEERYAFVTNRASGTVSVIDAYSLEKIADLATGPGPVSVAYSPRVGAAYVTHHDDGTIVGIDGATHTIRSRVGAEPGLGDIRFAPGGRLAFVLNPEADVVHILDASTNRIAQTGDFHGGPDQVAFSDELAYIRHRDSEIVLMIPIDEVGQAGRPVPVVDFPGGLRPFGQSSRSTAAAGIVQAPGANAVLVANPADKMIYFYKEGMAAPMGSFHNYGREPLAVMVVDRSLRERRPAVYETTVRLRRPGAYDLALFLDSPRVIHCFGFTVEPNPDVRADDRRPSVAVVPFMEDSRATVDRQVILGFRLTDPLTAQPLNGLEDVQILTFKTPGRLQRRHAARAAGDGVYEVSYTPPAEGIYYVFLRCASLGISYNRSRPFILEVVGTRGENGTGVEPAPSGEDE